MRSKTPGDATWRDQKRAGLGWQQKRAWFSPDRDKREVASDAPGLDDYNCGFDDTNCGLVLINHRSGAVRWRVLARVGRSISFRNGGDGLRPNSREHGSSRPVLPQA